MSQLETAPLNYNGDKPVSENRTENTPAAEGLSFSAVPGYGNEQFTTAELAELEAER